MQARLSATRLARERLPTTTIGFSTNASLLKGRVADELLHSGLDELWFDIIGDTRATDEVAMGGLTAMPLCRSCDYPALFRLPEEPA